MRFRQRCFQNVIYDQRSARDCRRKVAGRITSTLAADVIRGKVHTEFLDSLWGDTHPRLMGATHDVDSSRPLAQAIFHAEDNMVWMHFYIASWFFDPAVIADALGPRVLFVHLALCAHDES